MCWWHMRIIQWEEIKVLLFNPQAFFIVDLQNVFFMLKSQLIPISSGEKKLAYILEQISEILL